MVERLAAETGMADWGARDGHSLAFMARQKVESRDWHKPSGARHPFVEIVPAGTDLRVFGVHLSAVHSNWTEWRRMRELRATLRSIERHQQGIHVLAGDFNTLAPGELLDTRLLPPRLRALVWLGGGRVRYETIKIMLDARYLDASARFTRRQGFHLPTWSATSASTSSSPRTLRADCLKDCQVVTTPPPSRKPQTTSRSSRESKSAEARRPFSHFFWSLC